MKSIFFTICLLFASISLSGCGFGSDCGGACGGGTSMAYSVPAGNCCGSTPW